MNSTLLSREKAEQYLDELLEAELNHDYQLCCRRWEKEDIYENFSEEQFAEEIKINDEHLGQYQRREYIGCEIVDGSSESYRKRFVWKTDWTLGRCVIVVGIHEHEEVVYLNEWMYHCGEENLCLFLLNTKPDVSPKNEASHSLGKSIAELVLDEMLDAELTSNYAAWSQRWETGRRSQYTEEDFLRGIKNSLEDIGHYKSREYIGRICYEGENGKTYNYVWKSRYEKEAAIINLGIYEKDGVVYLDEFWTSWGDDHIYMLLLNHQL